MVRLRVDQPEAVREVDAISVRERDPTEIFADWVEDIIGMCLTPLDTRNGAWFVERRNDLPLGFRVEIDPDPAIASVASGFCR